MRGVRECRRGGESEENRRKVGGREKTELSLNGDLMVCWTKLISMTREFKAWFSLVPRLCSLQEGSGNQTRYG